MLAPASASSIILCRAIVAAKVRARRRSHLLPPALARSGTRSTSASSTNPVPSAAATESGRVVEVDGGGQKVSTRPSHLCILKQVALHARRFIRCGGACMGAHTIHRTRDEQQLFTCIITFTIWYAHLQSSPTTLLTPCASLHRGLSRCKSCVTATSWAEERLRATAAHANATCRYAVQCGCVTHVTHAS